VLEGLLGSFGEITRRDVAWSDVRDAKPLWGCNAVWRISVKPSDGPAVIAALPAGCQSLVDWGGGLVWVGTSGGDIAVTHGAVQAQVAALGGHATLIKGPEAVRAAVPVFQPEAPGVANLSAALRRRFDPRGILNQGLMAA